jgi:hypothetical protein
VLITVNGKDSEEVGMMLGPAGEAFFVAEEIDTELLAFDKQGEESEQKQEGRISHH